MKVLMVMAHPDDEVIFGWPVLQQDWEISLIVMTNNKARYGPGPMIALQEVAKSNGIRLLQGFQTDTNFYRLPPRGSMPILTTVLNQFMRAINDAVIASMPDAIFTHNPMGEYGHGDHRMLFNLVSLYDHPKLLTDICEANPCHLSSSHMPSIWTHFYATAISGSKECQLDMEWFRRMRNIYERHRAWSWRDHKVIDTCKLYRFE